jgi:3'-phosphoadenosine 5'-phosphosulfate sulfotransferase (PAPS reductase)/FAD synthetase
MFDEMDGIAVLRQAAIELLRGDLAIVSSFGADSAVLLHMVAQVDPDLPVYFLETGKHFPETLTYVETLKQHLGLTNVRALLPDPKDLARFDPDGDLWETTRIRAATSARPSRSRRCSKGSAAGSRAASATRPRSAASCRISS